MLTLRDLLIEEGFGPWTTYKEWDLLVHYADAIANTIQNKMRRCIFIGETALYLSKIYPSKLENSPSPAILHDHAWSWYFPNPTPYGATELWGNVMQELDELYDIAPRSAP